MLTITVDFVPSSDYGLRFAQQLQRWVLLEVLKMIIGILKDTPLQVF